MMCNFQNYTLRVFTASFLLRQSRKNWGHNTLAKEPRERNGEYSLLHLLEFHSLFGFSAEI